MALFDAGSFAEAEAPLRECLALRDELRKLPVHIRPYGANDDWLASMNNLGRCCEMQGRLDDALPLLEECLKRRRATFQNSNEFVQLSFKNLANLMQKLGRLDEAESLRATAAGEAVAPREPEPEQESSPAEAISKLHAEARALNDTGVALFKAGNYSEAEAPLRACFEAYTKLRDDFELHLHPPNTSVDWLASMNNLGRCCEMQGRLQDALPLLVECLATRQTTWGDSHPSTQTSFKNLANLMQKLGRLAEAESLRATAAGEAAAPREPEQPPPSFAPPPEEQDPPNMAELMRQELDEMKLQVRQCADEAERARLLAQLEEQAGSGREEEEEDYRCTLEGTDQEIAMLKEEKPAGWVQAVQLREDNKERFRATAELRTAFRADLHAFVAEIRAGVPTKST